MRLFHLHPSMEQGPRDRHPRHAGSGKTPRRRYLGVTKEGGGKAPPSPRNTFHGRTGRRCWRPASRWHCARHTQTQHSLMAPAGGGRGPELLSRAGSEEREARSGTSIWWGTKLGGVTGASGSLTWPICPSSLQAHPPATQHGPCSLPIGPPKSLARLPTCTGSSPQSSVRSASPHSSSPVPAPQTGQLERAV